MKSRLRFTLQLGFTLLVCLFMIVPVAMSVMAGLTENYFVGLESGLTLRWVNEVWQLYADTIWLSIKLALACLLITILVGVPAAYGLLRSRRRWANAIALYGARGAIRDANRQTSPTGRSRCQLRCQFQATLFRSGHPQQYERHSGGRVDGGHPIHW